MARFVPKNSLLVLNNTKVVPARLFLRKETGGKIEVFVLVNEMRHTSDTNEEIPVIVDRKCAIGWRLFLPSEDFFEVTRQEEKKFFVRLVSRNTLSEVLEQYGETPIPHYLEEKKTRQKRGPNETLLNNEHEMLLRKRYQTIFASEGASVAAPTAALHFTERVFLDLDVKGVTCAEVTLDVGLGTFAPLRAEHFETGKLHTERIDIPSETAVLIHAAKQDFRQVIAVGTTALRTLESAARTKDALSNGTGSAFSGETDIFMYPPYRFRIADVLITNFHLPKSSLMLLVDAFLEHKRAPKRILDLYRIAIAKEYAFYSFGDSMLIL
jgi:S-adenosylmethionine:tRNA ribosyltransferase-isomerase